MTSERTPRGAFSQFVFDRSTPIVEDVDKSGLYRVSEGYWAIKGYGLADELEVAVLTEDGAHHDRKINGGTDHYMKLSLLGKEALTVWSGPDGIDNVVVGREHVALDAGPAQLSAELRVMEAVATLRKLGHSRQLEPLAKPVAVPLTAPAS